MDCIFLPKKKKGGKKKKIAAARLALILATRWTGNILFFMESLIVATDKIGTTGWL